MAVAPTTWNPADKNANIVVGGNGLNVSWSVAVSGVVRSIFNTLTGKYYWEVKVNSFTGNFVIGIANQNGTTTTNPTSNANCCSLLSSSPNIWSAGANTNITIPGGALAVGSVVSIAVDVANRLIWFRHNGGTWNETLSTTAPTAGTGGISISGFIGTGLPLYATVGGNAGTACNLDANFGQSAFVYPVPSGYETGFGPVPTFANLTQIASEQWIAPSADARLTQLILEQWGPAGTTTPLAVMTQISLEEWGTVAQAIAAQQARAWILA